MLMHVANVHGRDTVCNDPVPKRQGWVVEIVCLDLIFAVLMNEMNHGKGRASDVLVEYTMDEGRLCTCAPYLLSSQYRNDGSCVLNKTVNTRSGVHDIP